MAANYKIDTVKLTRREFVAGASSLTVFAGGSGSRLHLHPVPQPDPDNPLHRHLAAMWDNVRRQTRGRVDTTVYPLNNHIAGSDPAALRMPMSGEIQFFTLMGGALGAEVDDAGCGQS